MTRPIVPGFHPDPSICRVGDAYYLANSSFEYVPGVPIRRSTDLVSWELLGHALTRPGQLPPSAGAANTGIYAPTLRHHDGRFHLVTTNILHEGHLIVTAENPEGPWSDPVHVRGTEGIDPDLCWDEDGVCHLTWASFSRPGITSVPIDPVTGRMLAEPRLLWNGTGLAAPEGPHLYRVDGWWYLLLAEGGTERGHAITIARARSIEGPYEPAPSNPILTHRSTTHPVQNTGHGDLVECADGRWAMVYLGVRPRGKTPQYHVNGRETFLAGVDWVDGWPVIDENRFTVPLPDNSFTDTFPTAELHPRWVAPGAAPRTRWHGGLVLRGFLLTRAPDEQWTAEAHLDVSEGTAAFVVRIDDRHWYGLTADGETVTATLAIGPAVQTVAAVPAGSRTSLRIRALAPAPSGPFHEVVEPDLLELSVVPADGPADVLGTFGGRYLSTEVAAGFTGRMIGVRVLEGTVALREFRYLTGR
ncbi:glycoside hydrolase family 43 protein [Amycolatopsis sp. CA-128772]|uniref:glycoside hydrolase family 43 protein n=1 Tax=Amycolatopsis sp. CA-128772 TaxID=2073159 RepID=UPI000CD272D4|nr:glycoside hydrolase family 43 protein [Amycolatopsis sp. CA-128772]